MARLRKIILLIVCVITLCSCDFDPIYYEKTLNAGDGRTIHIFAYDNYDVTRSYDYEVYEGSILIQDGALAFLAPHENPDFLMYKSVDGTIVGIYKKGQPNNILMLHDFSTKENYPHVPGSYDGSEGLRLRNKLLSKLQKDFPDIKMK